jgi:hypothetical protein
MPSAYAPGGAKTLFADPAFLGRRPPGMRKSGYGGLVVCLVGCCFLLLGIFLRLVFRSSAWDIFCLLYGFWFGFGDMSGLVLVFGFWFFSSRLFWFQVFLIALFCFGFFVFRHDASGPDPRRRATQTSPHRSIAMISDDMKGEDLGLRI